MNIKVNRQDMLARGACFDPWTDGAFAAQHSPSVGAKLDFSEVTLDVDKLRRYKPQWFNWLVLKGLVKTVPEKAEERLKRLADFQAKRAKK
jgi:predicted deacylase